jgi:mono/diheme cytochrome c family protein
MPGRSLKPWAALILLGCCALMAGCGQSTAQFHLNMVAMAKNNVSEPQQQQIANILTALFGTPDEPFAPAETGLDLDKLKRASGPAHRDAPTGSAKGLYREHCVHCHGISGDGAGPTAAFLNPYPRDYREGWFKFKSTKLPDRPTVANLMRTLHEGIPGTAMPSFKLMPDLDRDALVEYVRYLSMRGEMELELASAARETKGEALKEDHDSLAEILEPVAASWLKQSEVAVTDRPANMQFDKFEDEKKREAARDLSIALGREMFTHEAQGVYKPKDGSPPIKYQGAACIKCHGPTGLGDGQATDYDDWTKFAYDPAKWPVWDKEKWGEKPTQQGEQIPSWLVMPLGALPERHIVPRNLRLGVYRGGRRPLDIYYRLHEGIKGTPMPQIAVLYLPEEVQDLTKSTEAEFAKSSPEPMKKDGESDADFATRKKDWDSQRTSFVTKKVSAAKEDWQNRRTWNVIDYVMSLPYEPGGELGADADYTDVGHGELHAR